MSLFDGCFVPGGSHALAVLAVPRAWPSLHCVLWDGIWLLPFLGLLCFAFLCPVWWEGCIARIWLLCAIGGLLLDGCLAFSRVLFTRTGQFVSSPGIAAAHCVPAPAHSGHGAAIRQVPSAVSSGDGDSQQQGLNSRCVLKLWARHLKHQRVTWTAHKVGRRLIPASRSLKFWLRRRRFAAFARLASEEVFVLRARHRKCIQAITSCAAAHSCEPFLRGGALSKSDRILQGLTALLESEQFDEEPSTVDDESAALMLALEGLVKRKPSNLLQELKSLVQTFTHKACVSNKGALGRSGTKGGIASADKGKGKGKDAEKGKNANILTDNRGKGKDKPSDRSAATPAPPVDAADESSWVDVVKKRRGKPGDLKNRAPAEVGKPRRNDWNAPVATSAADLEAHITTLTNAPRKALVALAPNPREAELMWEILGAHEDVDALFVFNYVTHKEFVPETKSSLGIEPLQCTIPLWFASGLRHVQRYTMQRGENAPKANITSVKIEGCTSSKSSSILLRAKTRKGLVAKWDKASSNPGYALRLWCTELDSSLGNALRESFKWELVGESDLQGLCKVDASKVDAFIQSSGMLAGSSRWYLEPLKWEAPLKQTVNPVIEWIEHHEIAAAAKIAAEKAKLVNLGVTLGKRQVGVRKPRPAQEQPRRRRWQFLNIPNDLTGEDVAALAAEAGFSDVEIENNFRWRNCRGWSFRASRSDQASHLELQVGQCRINASCDFGRVHRRTRVPIAAERRVVFSGKGTGDPPTRGSQSSFGHVRSSAGFGSSKGSEPSPMDTEVAGGKREGSPVAKPEHSAKKPKTDEAPLPEGLSVVPNAGNGNCLFHALSDAFFLKGQSKSPGVLRAMAVTHLRKYRDAYFHSWDRCTPDEKQVAMQDSEFDKYLDAVAAEGAWGSALELTAVANTCDFMIRVVSAKGTYVFNAGGKKGALTLRFHSQHFEALKGEVKREVDWGQMLEGPRVGLRAGGRSCASIGTSSSVKRKLCPRTLPQKARVPRSGPV